ncbi:MAG: DUF1273 family protein [Oscillospiraceae bacterium]|nr:DUF1273 family protein [Oscillospiraceae bacterium]
MDGSVCAFSGHRQIYTMHSETLLPLLSDTVDTLISSGVTRFCSGGAMGFDLLAAELILEKKKNGAEISLSMILPCRNQSDRWPAATRRRYDAVLQSADEVIYVADNYNQFCMHLRNRRLVDEADILLCYLVREASGTAFTRNYAIDRDKKIINLADLL